MSNVHGLSKKDIKVLVQYLKSQPQYGNFTINKMHGLTNQQIAKYQLWLTHNGFVVVIDWNYIDSSIALMKLSDRGRRLHKSRSYKWLLFKEWLDSAMKYISFIISIIALIISFIALAK